MHTVHQYTKQVQDQLSMVVHYAL